MMKKLISLFLTVSMLLSCLVVMPALAEEQELDITKQTNLLRSVGIISSIPKDGEITRAEFAIYAAQLFGLPLSGEQETPFVDVPADHWAAPHIATLAYRNIISLPADRIFRPNDILTENEAVKMLASICGYTGYSNAVGGWMAGYTQAAVKLGFTYTGSNEKMTVHKALIMLYDALNAHTYEVIDSQGSAVTYGQTGETLLSKNFDVYATFGVVKQSIGVALDSSPSKGKTPEETAKRVKINDTVYTTEVSLYDYLGTNVVVYYKQASELDTPHIICREDYKKASNVLTIDIEDFAGYNNGTVTYYTEDAKIKKIDVPSSAYIVQNGKANNSNLANVFTKENLKKGIIKFIDTEDDGTTDYVLISSYENVFVSGLNAENYYVYNAFKKSQKLNLDPEKKVVYIENAQGVQVDFSAITEGQLLTVYESANYVRVIINSDGITASVYSTKTENDKFMIEAGKSETDRVWYEVDKNYYQNEISKISLAPGAKITYYKDAFGKIAYISSVDDSNHMFVYLIKLINDTDNDKVGMKVFTEKGQIETVMLAKRVNVDGYPKSTYAEISADLNKVSKQQEAGNTYVLEDGEHEINGQVLRIKKNANGEISAIDSARVNKDKEGENSLNRSWEYKRRYYLYHASAFTNSTNDGNDNSQASGLRFFYNANTVRFVVPPHGALKDAREKDFFLLNGNYIQPDGGAATEAYKLDLGAGYEDVIVWYAPADMDEATRSTTIRAPYIVDSVSEILNPEGEVVTQVKTYNVTTGVEQVFEPKEGYDLTFTYEGATKKISRGDIIKLKLTFDGKISEITCSYHYETNKGNPPQKLGWVESNGGQNLSYGIFAGYIKSEDSGIYRLLDTKPVASDYEGDNKYLFDWAAYAMNQNAPVLIYDGKNFTKSTVGAEFVSAEESGYSDAQFYYFVTYGSKISGALIYKK